MGRKYYPEVFILFSIIIIFELDCTPPALMAVADGGSVTLTFLICPMIYEIMILLTYPCTYLTLFFGLLKVIFLKIIILIKIISFNFF